MMNVHADTYWTTLKWPAAPNEDDYRVFEQYCKGNVLLLGSTKLLLPLATEAWDLEPKYPDPKIKDKDWFELRRGRFTASEIHKICTPTKITKEGKTYILDKVMDSFMEEFDEPIETHAMQWGKYVGLTVTSNSAGFIVNTFEFEHELRARF